MSVGFVRKRGEGDRWRRLGGSRGVYCTVVVFF
jgi:hypothetical protein